MYSMTKYEMYRAKQSLAIECHTIQLPQFKDCMTHIINFIHLIAYLYYLAIFIERTLGLHTGYEAQLVGWANLVLANASEMMSLKAVQQNLCWLKTQ